MSAEKTNNEEIVSRAFVKQYYHTLNESPQKDVKDEFLAVKFEDFTAEIETSLGVPYPVEHSRIIVFVNGHLTRKKDNVRNRFTQTFLLAQQDNGFCVVNDIFRFKKGQTQTQTCFLTETESKSEPEPVASRLPLPDELIRELSFT
ncbi:hypothetical protein Bca4012_084154 [Brassica carinata]